MRLGRIGSADVVRIIRERYGSMSPGIRLHASEAVGRIKLPQSESALLAMLNSETDRMMRTHIAQEMCELCVSEPGSLGKLRNMVNEGKWNLTMVDLDEDVAALFTIVGHEVPELSRWRAQAADKAHESRGGGSRSTTSSSAITSGRCSGLNSNTRKNNSPGMRMSRPGRRASLKARKPKRQLSPAPRPSAGRRPRSGGTTRAPVGAGKSTRSAAENDAA